MNNLNVLLLDDEQTIHDYVTHYLKDLYVVYSAKTYEEAEKLIKEKGVDFFKVFICDLYLAEERSGLEFILENLDGCKTIVTSGYLAPEVMDELIDNGIFAAMQKPIDMDTLLLSMNSIIRCKA